MSTALAPIEYKDHKINLLDTPGYTDFVGEVISALRVADGVLVLIDSVAGAEVGTEIALNYCDQFKLPRFIIINKMNRDNANFRKAMESAQELSTLRLIPVQLPWGEKQDFKGVIDLLSLKAYPGDGKNPVEIPADYADEVEAARMELIEAAAESEDALLEKYLEGEALSEEEIKRGLREVILSGAYAPVFVAAGSAEIGIAPLLDAMIDLFPSPTHIPTVVAKGKEGEEEASGKGLRTLWQPMSGKPQLILLWVKSPTFEFTQV